MAAVTETVHLGVRLPAELAGELAKIAKAEDRSVSYVHRQAIREFVENSAKRQEFKAS